MRAPPRTPQRPTAFPGIDLNLMDTVTILVTGVFAPAVAPALVHIPPRRPGIINHILVRIDHRAALARRVEGIVGDERGRQGRRHLRQGE